MQAKILELYKSCEEAQQLSAMMSGSGGASSPNAAAAAASGQALFNSLGYSGMAAMMGLSGAYSTNPSQLSHPSRNHYNTSVTASPYSSNGPSSNLYNYQLPSSSSSSLASQSRGLPVPPDVKIIKLPFYDIQAELLTPSSLIVHGNNRFQEAQFQFFLTPSQATDIASHRDIRMGSKLDYLYQIQLRFCPLSLEASKEMTDEFPPGITLQVNGKVVVLPNPIPTNRPGVEPKRPPKPCNITSYCKLSPLLPNSLNIKWAAEYGKGWVVGIWLVRKCTSDDLLERLKKRGIRNPEYTRKTIIAKMTDDDDVETESLRVSVSCPLGKMRMTLPVRPTTCNHLQCFDGSLFLQMNERKATWNCPVCDSKALFDNLMIDGYFMDVINSESLPKDQNDIILNPNGSWTPVPKEEENGKSSKESKDKSESLVVNGNSKKEDLNVDCIDLSDDDDVPTLSAHPPLPPPPPLPEMEPAPPPPPPPEIECIDLE